MNTGPEQRSLPVSVIIPAYNSAATIERALSSVIAQPAGYLPAEIIVVDDHSDDDTGTIAERLGARVIRHEHNRGAAAARNTAVAAAAQPWLAFLDADDEWLTNRLSALWPLRGSHVLVSGACVSFYDDDPERTPEYAGTVTRGMTVLETPAALIPQNLVMASATIVRRDVVEAAGGYDTAFRYAEDWDLWLRVLEHGTALLTPEVVTLYHRHGAQKSQRSDGPSEAHRGIVAGCVGRSWWSSSTARKWEGLQRWDSMKIALRSGRRRESGHLLRQLLRRPSTLRAVVARRFRHQAWQLHTRRLERASRAGSPSALNDALARRRAAP